MSDNFGHPQVRTSVKTCDSNPEQYEGTLTDGRIFYFRYRFGHAGLGFGPDLDSAVDDSFSNRVIIGEQYDGSFESTEQRDQVFAELFKAADDERLSA